MLKVFRFYADPGHGWARVPLAQLRELDLIGKITPYSYMRRDCAYLEEDCDLSTFFVAYRKRHGSDPVLRGHTSAWRQSRIRNYARYSPDLAAKWLEVL